MESRESDVANSGLLVLVVVETETGNYYRVVFEDEYSGLRLIDESAKEVYNVQLSIGDSL